MHDPLGLSIGTTNMVVARAGEAPVTRRSVLTRFPDRAPEVGLAADNSNLAGLGVVIAGFVECVGDRVPLVADDGSTHDPELLLVEAIEAMVTGAGVMPGSAEVTIAVPAHWRPAARLALGEALRTSAGQLRLGPPPQVVPDAVAALTALNADPGLPADGVVALLDFGGSGTNITLADARSDFEPIDETVRYPEFSGDQIDQDLLVVVLNEVGRDRDASATTAAEPLGQLREQCRQAKERLSAQTVTELVTELRGYRSSVQLTRAELEDLIHDPLSGVLSALEDMLKRNKIRWADLAAVATVGGGASIPLISERLSLYRGVPVVTTRQPAVSMAVGAALLTARESVTDTSTAASPAITTTAGIGALPTDDATATRMAGLATDDATATRMAGQSSGDAVFDEPDSPTSDGEFAWSQEDGGDDPVPYSGPSFSEGDSDSRRLVSYVPARPPSEPPPPGRITRLPRLILGLAALLAMIAIGGVAYTLSSTTQKDEKAPPTPRPSVIIPTPTSIQPPPPSPAPPPQSVAPPAPSAAPPPPPSPEPPPAPPPVTTQPPPPRTTTRPPTTTTTTPPPTTTTTPPTTTTTPPTTTTTVPMTTEYLTIPFVPIPIPIQVPQKDAPAQPQNPYQPQNP